MCLLVRVLAKHVLGPVCDCQHCQKKDKTMSRVLSLCANVYLVVSHRVNAGDPLGPLQEHLSAIACWAITSAMALV